MNKCLFSDNQPSIPRLRYCLRHLWVCSTCMGLPQRNCRIATCLFHIKKLQREAAAIAVRARARLLPSLLIKKRGGRIEPGQRAHYRIRPYTALQWVGSLNKEKSPKATSTVSQSKFGAHTPPPQKDTEKPNPPPPGR